MIIEVTEKPPTYAYVDADNRPVTLCAGCAVKLYVGRTSFQWEPGSPYHVLGVFDLCEECKEELRVPGPHEARIDTIIKSLLIVMPTINGATN